MRKVLRLVLLSTLLLALLSVATRAEIGRGRHKRVFAVPAPEKVTIDGKLDEWDLSGQILIYVLPQTRESQSANFALMYDDDALYVGAEVKDPNPMMNRHDPKVEPGRGWDADACQIRLALDPDMGFPLNYGKGDKQANVAHLTLWHYTDAGKPCMQMKYGFYRDPERWPSSVVPRKHYDAKYRKGPKGLSYTFEYRIPWETLGVTEAMKGGDLVAGSVQFNWSRPDGRKTAGGSAWAYDVMSGSAFPYQTAGCWGKIIFSKEGNLSRELVEQGVPPEKPLPLTFEYNLPEPGEVTIALYNEDGTMVRQIITEDKRNAGHNIERWDGLDDLGRPLPDGQYTWKGLYHDGLDLEFRLSVHNSGNPPWKGTDPGDAWGANHGEPREACAAGDYMLLAWDVTEGCSGIIRTDLKGNKHWGTTHTATHLAAGKKRFFAAGGHGWSDEPGVRVYSLKDGRRLNYSDGSGLLTAPEKKDTRATGLAWHEGTLYASYGELNLVAAYNPARAKLTRTWKLDSPGRLATLSDGTVLVIVGGEVVRLTETGSSPVITDNIEDPKGIAVDEKDRIYVSSRGSLHNVSVFSVTGEYQRSIGRKGGRPRIGKWVPGGMINPDGLDVDKNGRLWVTEDLEKPKRISVWNPRNGKLVDDFFGASSYSTNATMDPADMSRVYCHGVQWKVNIDKGTWEPEAVVVPGSSRGMRVFTAKNGHQYATVEAGGGLKLMIRDGDRFRTVAGVLSRAAFDDMEWYERRREKAIEEQNLNRGYKVRRWERRRLVWSDLNRDGKGQESEVQRAPMGNPSWVDRDLSFYGRSGFHYVASWRLPIASVSENGMPTYDAGAIREYGPGRMDPVKTNDTIADADENALYMLGGPVPLDDPQYPRLTKFSFDGERLWGYWRIHSKWKRALNLPMADKGTAIGTVSLLGKGGDYIMAKTYFGSAHVWSSDGLYVDRLFKQSRTGASGHDVIGCEWVHGGHFMKTTKSGRYFVLAGDQDGRVNEVMGLDSVGRLKGGTYRISTEQAAEVAQGLEEYQARKAQGQRLVVARGRGSLEKSEGVGKQVDEQRTFTARAAYDENHLYVSYDVRSPYPLTNSVKEPRIIFTGGNCLDVQIAANPDAPEDREEPAPGDVRLVITRQDGNTAAVLYRPRVKDFEGDPIVLKSPVDRESFDRIRVVSDEVDLQYREQNGSFRATAAIPLELIGWEPQPASTVRMDLGYIFGNQNGSNAALRSYWANNSPEANVTDDIPDESRLNPEHWGTALVE